MVSKVGLQLAALAQDVDICLTDYMKTCHKFWKHTALPALSCCYSFCRPLHMPDRCQMCVLTQSNCQQGYSRGVMLGLAQHWTHSFAPDISHQCGHALQGLQWEFAVIDEPENVNAFVAPGGKVVFYTGLLRMLKTKDEVAAVLGHEAAHVVARHTASSFSFYNDEHHKEQHSCG